MTGRTSGQGAGPPGQRLGQSTDTPRQGSSPYRLNQNEIVQEHDHIFATHSDSKNAPLDLITDNATVLNHGQSVPVTEETQSSHQSGNVRPGEHASVSAEVLSSRPGSNQYGPPGPLPVDRWLGDTTNQFGWITLPHSRSFQTEPSRREGSKTWSPLLQDSTPDLAIDTDRNVLQPPIGTGSRSGAPQQPSTAAGNPQGATNIANAGLVDPSVHAQDGPQQSVMPTTQQAQQSAATVPAAEAQQSAAPEVATSSQQSAAPVVATSSQQSTAQAQQITAPVVAQQAPVNNALVQHIISGGLAQPGDELLWLYERARPLPFRNVTESLSYHTSDPRLVSVSQRVGRACANYRVLNEALMDHTPGNPLLLNGNTYLLQDDETRHYPHEMDMSTAAWRQTDSLHDFWTLEHSEQSLVEAFDRAGEAIRFFNPELFQMAPGVSVMTFMRARMLISYRPVSSTSRWTISTRCSLSLSLAI